MNKFLTRGAVLMFCSAPLFSHDPITTKLTWTQEVSRIVYKHCASCHQTGGSAMSLTTYADARPWAKAIRDEVTSHRMPPWGAVAGIGDFQNDPSLTSTEIDMLVAWVEGGAPEGDAAYLPHRIPSVEKAGPLPKARELTVTGDLKLNAPKTLLAIRPMGTVEAWAILPDQTVTRLIWVRDYQKKWARTYVFRVPLKLPSGTRIRTAGSSVVFSTQ